MRCAAAAAAGLLALLSVSAAGGDSTRAGNCLRGSNWPAPGHRLADELVELVNAHRRRLKRPALRVSPALTRSASWKAAHMARYRYLRHDDPAPPAARGVGERLLACGYPANRAAWGENIAYGYRTPAAVMDAWLDSRRHRAAIEHPRFTIIGVGAAPSRRGLFYWAQNFGLVAVATAERLRERSTTGADSPVLGLRGKRG